MLRKFSVLLLICLYLSACGFHLRGGGGEAPQWLNNVAIMTDSTNAALVSMLQSALDANHIIINAEPAKALYWLHIGPVIYQKQLVSVGASTNPRQYQLTLIVGFMLQTRNGQIIKPHRQVTVSRQLTVNNDRILGSNDEESILLREMQQDSIIQLLNRLGSITPPQLVAVPPN